MAVKPRHLLLFAILLMCPWRAFAGPITFEILTTFDYPGANAYTTATGINERGDVAGTYLDQSSIYRGFVRFADGRLSDPIIEPDGDSTTFAEGINSSRTVCGGFSASGENKGYFLSGSTFTEFDLGTSFTDVRDLNDLGNFCGDTISPGQGWQGFVTIGGTLSTISLGDGSTPSAAGINNLDQVVGSYSQGGRIFGYRRDADGTLSYPIVVAGALSTQLHGVNDSGVMVGYVSIEGKISAALFQSPGQYTLYDYPGATETYFYDINNRGLICGTYYHTGTGKVAHHGFIARVRPATRE